jgi:MerR family copper efflux transcriptional regulator
VGFARRLGEDGELRDAVEAWLRAEPARPEEVPASDWLRWEQDKHERLLAAATQSPTHVPENA